MSSFVRDLASDAEFDDVVNAAPATKLVVVDFTATWCGPCKAIKPFFHELAGRFRHVQFVTVDIDKLKGTATKNNVTSVPTFSFYKNKQLITQIKGANPNGLQDLVNQHQGPAEDSGVGSSVNLGGHSDITEFITTRQVECLNQSEAHTVASIFTKDTSTYLESDVDEQLIINIPFNQAVKLHTVKIVAHADKAPKTLKTYVNRPSTLSFDEADSTDPTEILTLSSSSYTPVSSSNPNLVQATLPLRFVKYQSVHGVTLFIENNIGDAETTTVCQVVFYGSPIESTKALSELKKEHSHE